MAVAKRPVPLDAIIPADDIEKSGKITLKIWPPEHVPESLVVDLDCQLYTKHDGFDAECS